MAKCGAITRKGTPCKLPGTRNGRCWLHEDKYADRSKRFLEIQSIQGPEEELSFDLLDASDNVLSEYFSTRHQDFPIDMVGDHDAIFNDGDFDSDEELTFDFLDTPNSPFRVNDPESDEELPLKGARNNESELFEAGACIKSNSMDYSRKEQHKRNSIQQHEETVPPMKNEGRVKKFLLAEKEQGSGSIGKKEISISFLKFAAIIFIFGLISIALYKI